MIKPLHPSLKACKCGYICTKRELYKHFDDIRRTMKALNEPAREFFAGHGEVPLNVDDSRLNIESQLEKSLEDGLTGEHDVVLDAIREESLHQNLIPSGHRLDDNNTEYPRK